jgi:effector-binding domain-containing protein
MFQQACRLNRQARWPLTVVILCAAGCAAHHHRRLVLSPWTPLTSQPASLPSSRASVTVSEMTLQNLPEQNFFYESTRSTPLALQQTIERITADLAQAENDGKVTFTGPCVFVFRGRSAELRRPFTVEIGFAVAGGARPFDHFQVRRLTAFHCAAVTFKGPGSLIDKAYDVLDPAVDVAGLRRTDETREVYLNWQGPNSPQDQILIGIGVK